MEKLNLFGKSPIEYLSNLSSHLGPSIYIKRDDVSCRAGGGNKLRKYERIIFDAIESGCDTLIIAGHLQSNATRELVGVARMFNLRPIVVGKNMIPEQNADFSKTGNALLMHLMDAEIIEIQKEDDFGSKMKLLADKVATEGGKAYIIPFGGSNYLGSLGYVDCANEIIEEMNSSYNKTPNYIITPTGSGGTQAGLLAGLSLRKISTKVLGVSVLHTSEQAVDIVSSISKEILEKNNASDNVFDCNVDDRFIGDGYGLSTQEGINAIKLIAKLEAIFLCPIYTGKAMAALIQYCDDGRISSDDTVVFLHTGGSPLLYSYFNHFYE